MIKCVDCDYKNLRQPNAGYCEEHKWCSLCLQTGKKVEKSTDSHDMKEYGYCKSHCDKEAEYTAACERREYEHYGDIQDDLPSDYYGDDPRPLI